MDGENITDEDIAAAAVAVGASVIEHWSTTVSGIAVLWSIIADGFVSCYDCYPMMRYYRCPTSFSNFKLGG